MDEPAVALNKLRNFLVRLRNVRITILISLHQHLDLLWIHVSFQHIQHVFSSPQQGVFLVHKSRLVHNRALLHKARPFHCPLREGLSCCVELTSGFGHLLRKCARKIKRRKFPLLCILGGELFHANYI